MKHIFITAIIVILSTLSLSAQQFLNGSFEHNDSMIMCMQNDTATFNANTGDAWIHTGPDKVYFGDTSCSTPAHGNYYIGLGYTSLEGGSNLILRLAAPMVAGTKYKFSFSYRKSVSAAAALLYVGYNHPADSFGHDSFVNIIPAPTLTSWTTVTDSITPAINTRFIYIRAASPGASPLGTYIDNFVMAGVPPLKVGKVLSVDDVMSVFPNPLSSNSKIVISNEVALPYRLSVCNVMGKTVYEMNGDATELSIRKNDLPGGIYFIKLVDNTGKVWYKRVAVE